MTTRIHGYKNHDFSGEIGIRIFLRILIKGYPHIKILMESRYFKVRLTLKSKQKKEKIIIYIDNEKNF